MKFSSEMRKSSGKFFCDVAARGPNNLATVGISNIRLQIGQGGNR